MAAEPGRSTRSKRGPLRWSATDLGWLEGVRWVASPNFNERPAATHVDTLIIHYISLPPGVFHGDAVERLFLNRLSAGPESWKAEIAGLEVSAHFLIRRRGETTQFVSTDRRAWHAGPSHIEGRERCNDFSIGVELEGDGLTDFTEAQYRRLDELVAALRQRHPLRLVAGHSDIAPGRKSDPGPRFKWNRVLAGPAFSGLRRPF